MRRFTRPFVLCIVLVLLSGAVAWPSFSTQAHQVATPVSEDTRDICVPAGEPPEYGEDVTADRMGAEPTDAPDEPGLTIVGFTLQPDGQGIPEACYAEKVVAHVENVEGAEVTVRVNAGVIVVRRAGDIEGDALEYVEGPDEEVLGPGDSFSTDIADYGVQNTGDDQVVVTAASLSVIRIGCPCPTWPR